MADDVDSNTLSKAAPLPSSVLHPFRALALVLFLTSIAAFLIAQAEPAAYEASAYIKLRAGSEAITRIEDRLMSREALQATAARHGIDGPDAALQLRQAVALHPLTSQAGASLELPPEISGVVITARRPDAEQAMQVANDLALQVLDLGNAGELAEGRDELVFYRNEEGRLWQEVSALRAEISAAQTSGSLSRADTVQGDERKLTLLQDQYDQVRAALAEAEVAARLSDRLHAQDHVLLQRATMGQPVRPRHLATLALVASALLLAGMAIGLREHLWPRLLGQGYTVERFLTGMWSGMEGSYRMLDDPARPILGMPRFAVLTVLAVGLLVSLSLMLG